MAQTNYGSIDFSKLLEEAKKGNKAFHKSDKNGRIYLNVQVFIKDEVDNFVNSMAIRSTFKGATKDDKFYFGNFKPSKEQEQQQSNNFNIPGEDELFF
jgi:hypothetical protein